MMIHAYQEIYLSSARSNLGEAFDYAINSCNISGSDFTKMFLVSSVSKKLENGETDYLVGKSGIELAREICEETMGEIWKTSYDIKHGRSAEYWIGWAVAYYQWFSCRKYYDIFSAVSYEDMKTLYPMLHEADISKFVEVVQNRIKEVFPETNLKRMRAYYGCSQSELARGSGVGLRSIQMYEQRNKNINKASVETVYQLARFLGCTIEDLLEHDA